MGGITAEQRILPIELSGEAKDVAAELAKRHGATEGDVVARALGLVWWLDEEVRNGSRIAVIKPDGETRPVEIFQA